MGVIESRLSDVAERVATEAAELVRDARVAIQDGTPLRIGTKSTDTDVVTAVDHEAERLVRTRLAELRPGEQVIGEEQGGTHGEGVTWVVDPIDGTVNFVYGYPWFAVSLAAQVDGVSVAGAVVEPVSGRRWRAVRGGGATLDGRPLSVSSPPRLDLTLVGTGFAYAAERRGRQAETAAKLLAHVRDIRRSGSAALDLCAVAAGWVDAYYEHGLSPWDWAAGALIAAEAGAVVTSPGTDPAAGADFTCAAAPSVAAPLRDALIECGAARI
ncbi:inositol monophosphatase family protein [Amycolatopsis cihanbeyliensis]|uniref:inositol monophosphatase family protein n=1 Tax=Amycolatopsis cihanbeyliensis TaxID=1128664 RepID=UPI0014773E8B|nr:inositol monophosphatase family protein [Amycolatopsis cihanbeyliensis]